MPSPIARRVPASGRQRSVSRQPIRRQPPATTKSIPFDYVFQLPLTGERGNKVQDVVEISVEGVFVALSVGYSLAPDEQRTSRTFSPVFDPGTTLQPPVIIPLFNPNNALESILVAGMPEAEVIIIELDLTQARPPTSPRIVGNGRLGADGTETIDLQARIATGIIYVWDRTNNLFSQLFEINPTLMTPVIGINPQTQKLPAEGDQIVHVYGSPADTDPVSIFLLESATGNIKRVRDTIRFVRDISSFEKLTGRAEVTLNEPLSAGDTLVIKSENFIGISFSPFIIPRPRLSTLTLGALAAGLETIGADLTRGFRLNPNFAGTDLPLDQLAAGTLERIFQTGDVAAEEVSFLYSIDVTGSGREYQNKPIHNIAGLGIANGDRPFRPFSRPVAFEPRSVIRIQVEELSGPPGTLFIVLQGYKILGAGQIPG